MFIKVTKYLLKAIGAVLALILIYVVVAVILSIWSTAPAKVECEDSTTIFIASNGVHLDIILPKASIPRHLLAELVLESTVQYAAFGWGDRGFYLETLTW